MNETVKTIINSIYPISATAIKKLSPLLTQQIVTKDTVFIKKDFTDEKEYFLIAGICKSYLHSPEGAEITISFFKESSVLSPNSIRTVNGISNLNFKALSDCTLVWINAKAFEELMITDTEIRAFANTVLQNELMMKIEKETGLASLTARERLINFRTKFKNLENHIPHTDIASYLGITNISLSRLRKDLRP